MASTASEQDVVSPRATGSKKRKRSRPQPAAAYASVEHASPSASVNATMSDSPENIIKRIKPEKVLDEPVMDISVVKEEVIEEVSPDTSVKQVKTKKVWAQPVMDTSEVREEVVEDVPHAANDEDWKKEDLEELFQRIAALLPSKANDTVKYSTQADRLNWSEVQFGEHSAADCQQQWAKVAVKLRRFRTLTDLLEDAHEWLKRPNTAFGRKPIRHPDLPKKPLTPFFRYFLAKRQKFGRKHPELMMTQLAKQLSTKYRALPEHKKKKYTDEFLAENEVYKQQFAKFRAAHPDLCPASKSSEPREYVPVVGGCAPRPITAMQLYINHKCKERLDRGTEMSRKMLAEMYRGRWVKLDDHKKMKYISKAIEAKAKYDADMQAFCQLNPDYQPKVIQTFLTKAQQKIKDQSEGKPAKPAPNGYGLFTLLVIPKLTEIANNQRMAEVSRRWKALSADEKNVFNMDAKKKMEEYRVKMQAYIDSLPAEERKPHLLELANGLKKVKKVEMEADSQDVSKTERPQKPVAAVFIFMKEHQAAYEKKYPGVDGKDLSRIMVHDFNRLSAQEQDKYKKKEEKERQKIQQQQDKENMQTKAKKAVKFPGEPSKPPNSGYHLFSKTLLATMTEVPSNQRLREIARQWRALSDNERNKYSRQRDKMQKDYLKSIAAFKKKLSPKDLKIYEALNNKSKKVLKRESALGAASENESDSSSDESDSDSDEQEKEDDDMENDSDDNDSSSDDEDDEEDEDDDTSNGVLAKSDKLQANEVYNDSDDNSDSSDSDSSSESDSEPE